MFSVLMVHKLLLLPCIINYVMAQRYYPARVQSRESLLGPGYDSQQVPRPANGPLEVGITISVLNIRSVKETELTLVLDIFFTQEWVDYRIQAPQGKVTLDNSWKSKLWVPDSFFKHGITGRVMGILSPSMYFVVTSDQKITMHTRVSVEMFCSMCFNKYPHDEQTCDFDVMSLSNTNDTVVFKMKSFKLTNYLMLTKYRRPIESSKDCTKVYPEATFSCVRGTLRMQRRLPYHMFKTYVPSLIIVLISFVGFWIPMTAYPARVALVVTSLLSLITQQLQTTAAINANYMVAIQVWMLICKGFVFLSLLEFAFAITWAERQKELNEQRARGQTEEGQRRGSLFQKITFGILKGESNPNLVDLRSRKIFPIAFCVCIILYVIYVIFYPEQRCAE